MGGLRTGGDKHERGVDVGDGLEADGVADGLADALAALRGDSGSHGDGGDAAGLAAEDAAGPAGGGGSLEDVLRHLRRFPAPGLSGHDEYLVLLQRLKNLDEWIACACPCTRKSECCHVLMSTFLKQDGKLSRPVHASHARRRVRGFAVLLVGLLLPG